MAARSDNLGDWVQIERAGGLVTECGYLGRNVETPIPELHADTRMDATKERNRAAIPNRVGNDHKLRKRKPSAFVNKLPSTEAILQHLVLLRGEVSELREQFRELEFACEIFTQAAEQRRQQVSTNAIELAWKIAGGKCVKSFEVFMCLVVKGRSVKETASELKTSAKNVQWHWARIRQALKLPKYSKGIVQATRLAHDAGLL